MNKNFNKFLNEIKDLKINIATIDGRRVLDLSYYNQFDGEFETKIKKLSENAYSDIILMEHEKINYFLNRLIEEKNHFNDFWKWYNGIDSILSSPTTIDFKDELRQFFNVNNYDETAIITQKFKNDLGDAAMFKNGELSGLIERIKILIQQDGSNDKKTDHSELKTDYTETQLSNFFDGLNENKRRIEEKRKSDFVKLFRGEKIDNWKPIEWTGSNPELATLIFILTKKEPIPSLVDKYFKTENTYDTHSKSGKRKENHAITAIFNKATEYNKIKK